MKTNRMFWYFTVLMALSFAALSRSVDPSRSVTDIRPPLRPTDPVNPLLVDNRPLAVQFFSTASRGLLTVVSPNPANDKDSRIAFRIYLKRHGEIVANSGHHESQVVTEINLNDVLAVARPGDWLVIEPVRKDDLVPRQTLLLTSPMYHWLLLPGKEGC